MLGSPTRGLITGVAAALGGSVMLSAAPASAGGFWLYEMGTPDPGSASTGRAALAKDTATLPMAVGARIEDLRSPSSARLMPAGPAGSLLGR